MKIRKKFFPNVDIVQVLNTLEDYKDNVIELENPRDYFEPN